MLLYEYILHEPKELDMLVISIIEKNVLTLWNVHVWQNKTLNGIVHTRFILHRTKTRNSNEGPYCIGKKKISSLAFALLVYLNAEAKHIFY